MEDIKETRASCWLTSYSTGHQGPSDGLSHHLPISPAARCQQCTRWYTKRTLCHSSSLPLSLSQPHVILFLLSVFLSVLLYPPLHLPSYLCSCLSASTRFPSFLPNEPPLYQAFCMAWFLRGYLGMGPPSTPACLHVIFFNTSKHNRTSVRMNSQRLWHHAQDLDSFGQMETQHWEKKWTQATIPNVEALLTMDNPETIPSWWQLENEKLVFFSTVSLGILTTLKAGAPFREIDGQHKTNLMVFL